MHFGHFPLGSNIGADSEQVKTLAAATGAPVASGDSRLIPSGEPLGTKVAAVKTDKSKKPLAKDKKSGRPGSDLATASAQRAFDAASRATAAPVAATQLPPPEAARPPVRIALPGLAVPKPLAPAPEQLPATGPAVIATSALPPAQLPPAQLPPAQPPAQTPSAQTQIVPVDPSLLAKPDVAPQPGFNSLPVTSQNCHPGQSRCADRPDDRRPADNASGRNIDP